MVIIQSPHRVEVVGEAHAAVVGLLSRHREPLRRGGL